MNIGSGGMSELAFSAIGELKLGANMLTVRSPVQNMAHSFRARSCFQYSTRSGRGGRFSLTYGRMCQVANAFMLVLHQIAKTRRRSITEYHTSITRCDHGLQLL